MLFGHGAGAAAAAAAERPLRVVEFGDLYDEIYGIVDGYIQKGKDHEWYTACVQFKAKLTDQIRVEGFEHDKTHYPNGSLIQLITETKAFSDTLIASGTASAVNTWLFSYDRFCQLTGWGSSLKQSIDAVLGIKDPTHFCYMNSEVKVGRRRDGASYLPEGLGASALDVSDLSYLEGDSKDCLHRALTDAVFRQKLQDESDALADKVISFKELFDQYSHSIQAKPTRKLYMHGKLLK